MALNELLQELSRRAEAEVAETLTRAKATADEIRRAADARCTARSADTLTTGSRAATAAAEHAVAEAVRSGRRAELEARERARDRVFAALRTRLTEVSESDAYLATLPARLTAAIAAIGDAEGEVRSSPSLKRRIGALIRNRPGLRGVSDPGIVAGFRVVTGDGRVEVDETLDHRLASEGAALSLVAMRTLETPS